MTRIDQALLPFVAAVEALVGSADDAPVQVSLGECRRLMEAMGRTQRRRCAAIVPERWYAAAHPCSFPAAIGSDRCYHHRRRAET